MFIQKLFPGFIWRKPDEEKVLYLTFDDGPIPEVTPWVLELLDAYSAKATFFCVGKNVERHPKLFEEILKRGHRVGNHTQGHISGWSTARDTYLSDVGECAKRVKSELFRPPYGRLRWGQVRSLRKNFKIVLWDVLSGDFDASISATKCWQNVVQYAEAGSIIVFHDSLKARERLQEVLPKVLSHYSNLGFTFRRIDD
ncbi:MAG TPA: polysaccharide deacetylase family protein [Phaeodactylibacter sp.]|nr:polysaccharide deacetylase family protein [Phaeodactylibacter sp.]